MSAEMGGDGTTMAVGRKSSDATNVRWEPYVPDQDPTRDSPLGYLIASGIFVASYRVVPVGSYLGADTAFLKGHGERLDPLRKRFDSRGQRRIDVGHRGLHPGLFEQLVGQQQRCEQ